MILLIRTSRMQREFDITSLSPEGAKFNSTGYRPVKLSAAKDKPCKGAINPELQNNYCALAGLGVDCARDPARCAGLLNAALSGLSEIFLIPNSRYARKRWLWLIRKSVGRSGEGTFFLSASLHPRVALSSTPLFARRR
ncbi:MAG: hypothetical protein AB1631_14775 [Acidobacteriota bacterium]